MSERELQDAIIETANVCGWLVYHTWRSDHSPSGFPDLTLVRAGRLIFAELKSAKGKLTVNQRQWVRALERAGQEVYVWYPQDLDDAIRILNTPRQDREAG